MDIKWLFIGFFTVLGVFRALKPEVFAKWIRLQWEDLSDSRGRLSASQWLVYGTPGSVILCARRSFRVKINVVGSAPSYNRDTVGTFGFLRVVEPALFFK